MAVPHAAAARLAAAVGAALVLAGAGGQEPFSVRMALETPAPTPYETVRYEVIERGPATSVVQRRRLLGHTESQHEMGLLTRDEAAELTSRVRQAGALDLPDAVAPIAGGSSLIWRIEVSLDGRAHSFRVRDPMNQRDRRYWALFEGVRAAVQRVTGRLPFRNVFFEPGRLGWADIVSLPVASVRVDGAETGHETPLYGYELSAGEHLIELRSRDGSYERAYRIRVDPGGTTRLAVDLR